MEFFESRRPTLQRRGMRWLIVAVCSALVFTACGGDGGEKPDMDVAEDALEAWNTGNVDAFLAFFADDAELDGYPAHGDDVHDGIDFFMTLGDETTLDECERWEDGRIRCRTSSRDDLSGRAGLTTEADLSFFVGDGLITRYSALAYDESMFRFIQEMGWWLEDAHPDVWAESFALPERCSTDAEYNCWGSWRGTRTTAEVLLEHVTEFIDATEHYSISE